MSPPVPREVDTLTPVPVIAASMSTVFHDDNAHSALWLFVAVTGLSLGPLSDRPPLVCQAQESLQLSLDVIHERMSAL